MLIYEINYSLLNKIFDLDKFIKQEIGTELKLQSGGYMDLIIEKIGDNKISMTHYYEQNGDLIPDPDMTISVYPEQKMVEALTYQDTYFYQNVYPEPGRVDLMLKKELNSFLSRWLRNLIEQGFREGGNV